MSGRTAQILGRFPAHLEAARRGKALGEAVDGVAAELDLLAARMAAVRRAHRLGEAGELADLLHIASIAGLSEGELELLFLRFARARTLLADLTQAADAQARDTAAEALLDLWPLDAPHPRLPLFAPATDGEPDLAAAATRLAEGVTNATRYSALTDATRTRIARTCALHADGNGTVAALMQGAANALDLDIGPLVHSTDRYWHAAPVQDRIAISRPLAAGEAGTEIPTPFVPAQEVLGLEENPLWRNTTDSVARIHGQSFTIIRRGFERALLQIRIKGLPGNRSVGPMLVNRDEGHGVGYAGTVPPGATLVFSEEGRATLDGDDVSSLAYAWQGGCFGGEDHDAKLDFVFDGAGRDPAKRPATFVHTTPPAALDREAIFPGAGGSLPMPGIAIGTTRLVLFVQEAHAASREGSLAAPTVRTVTPRTQAAYADASVFAPGPAETRTPAAEVALSWLEHRAFAARLLIPARMRRYDEQPDGTEVLRRTAAALERFRPLGVELKVEYIDDRWVLGEGVLTSADGADLIEQLRSATTLWAAPAQ
ncbi:MAG: hypothetical protein KF778_18775 [Rhodocyclaceae bacterium]|nr:hypothetical protein [Rhodocyclaceae bacterium]